MKAKHLIVCLAFVSGCSTGLLRAQSSASGKALMERVPLRVVGVILAHGVGLGTALILSRPDEGSRGQDLGQSDSFYTYESVLLTGSGKNRSDLYSLSLGGGKMIRPWLAANLKGTTLSLRDGQLDTQGLALELGFRLYPLRSAYWKLYYDSAVGACYTDLEFPRKGTKVNFISSLGLGLLYRIEPGLHWQLGFRHAHVSNAGWIAGDGRNPGFDANGAYTGLVITY